MNIPTPTQKIRHHGEFPARLAEETRLEQRWDAQDIEAGRTLAREPRNILRQKIAELKKEVGTKRRSVEGRLVGLCTALIEETRENQDDGFTALMQQRLLKELPPEAGFLLAAKCIRTNYASGFKRICLSIKKNNPLHPDIAVFQDSYGDTLGHMAAKCDRQEIVQYIACMNRDFLDIANKKGDTLCHTASRYSATETIEYLLGLSKRLFGIRNNSGQTALDLESGEIICRRIAIKSVHEDIALGISRREAAVKKIVEASRKPNGRPLIQIGRGYMKTEIVPIRDPALGK